MANDAQIITLADHSPLVQYDWPQRGPAPRAYLRGMAIAFARLHVLAKSRDDGSPAHKAITHAVQDQIGSPDSDVLSWYAQELQAAGASTTTADEKLVALFTVMLGLGMRESSGQHCAGADTPESRGEPTTEENAEAGLFQVSHDSIKHDALRQSLFDAFRDRTDLLDLFRQGVNCRASDWENHGTGVGAKFQDTMKKCPLFAALYTALYLRSHRSHWGPINRKKAEAKREAAQLFQSIQHLIERSDV